MSKKKIAALCTGILGILIGIIVFFMGSNIASEYDVSANTDSAVTFNGEYYTYQYRATAEAVDEIAQLQNQMNDVIGALIQVIGLVTIAAFVFLTVNAMVTDTPAKNTASTADDDSDELPDL